MKERNVKPISPNEIGKAKASRISDDVIEAFNELIAKHWNGKSATIKQDEVIQLILKKRANMGKESNRRDIFENKELDIEDLFRAEGWQVEYDKPGFNESYEASWTFDIPKF